MQRESLEKGKKCKMNKGEKKKHEKDINRLSKSLCVILVRLVFCFCTVFPFKMSLSAPLCTNAWTPPLYANERDVAGSQRPAPPPSTPLSLLKAYI